MRSLYIYFGVVTIVFFGVLFWAPPVYAAVDDNMFGFAWSETFGWMIFNSDPREHQNRFFDFGIPTVLSNDTAYENKIGEYCADVGGNLWAGYTNFCGTSGPFWDGFRWLDLSIPYGATVDNTYVRIRKIPGGSAIKTDMALENTLAPLTFFGGNSGPRVRWETAPLTSVIAAWDWSHCGGAACWLLSEQNPANPGSLKGNLDELMTLLSSGQELDNVSLLMDGTPSTCSSCNYRWGTGGGLGPRMYIEYTDAGTMYDFNFPSATGEDFGIDVNPTTGDFESSNSNGTGAYAWSSNVGWIKFNPTSDPPDFVGSYDGPAHFDVNTNKVTGWARVCSAAPNADCEGDGAHATAGGWDGWIYLGEFSGITGSGLTYDVDTKTLNGWAWSATDVNGTPGDVSDDVGLGWISFNNDYSDPADFIQTPSPITFATAFADIQVPPEAVNLREQYADYCSAPLNVVPVKLVWDFLDLNVLDKQNAFQILGRLAQDPVPGASGEYNTCPGQPYEDTFPTGGTCDPDPDNDPNTVEWYTDICQENTRPLVVETAGTVDVVDEDLDPANGIVLNRVEGTGTSFTTIPILPLDRITIEGETRTVREVSDLDTLFVENEFASTHTGASFVVNQPRLIDCTFIPHTADDQTPAISSYEFRYNQFDGYWGGGEPNQEYHWAVRVKDDEGNDVENWSEWPSANIFETINHQYPRLDFSISPTEPSVGEVVDFNDLSDCYWSRQTFTDPNVKNQRYDCFAEYPSDGLAAYNRYEWDFDGNGTWDCDSDLDGDGDIDNANCFPDPVQHVYNKVQLDVPATLRITDYEIASKGVPGGAYEGKLNPASGACTFTLDPADRFDVFPRTIQWREISPF